MNLHHDLTPTVEGAEYTVWLDVPVSRNKALHQVFDQDGDPVFAARYARDVFDWLNQAGARYVAVQTGLAIYWLSLSEHQPETEANHGTH